MSQSVLCQVLASPLMPSPLSVSPEFFTYSINVGNYCSRLFSASESIPQNTTVKPDPDVDSEIQKTEEEWLALLEWCFSQGLTSVSPFLFSNLPSWGWLTVLLLPTLPLGSSYIAGHCFSKSFTWKESAVHIVRTHSDSLGLTIFFNTQQTCQY